MALGICQVHGKAPIISCNVTPERNFAFIEFGDTSDATAALQLDGIPFRGMTLKIKRPKDYAHPYGVSVPTGPAECLRGRRECLRARRRECLRARRRECLRARLSAYGPG